MYRVILDLSTAKANTEATAISPSFTKAKLKDLTCSNRNFVLLNNQVETFGRYSLSQS
jgi:hypothetical protein